MNCTYQFRSQDWNPLRFVSLNEFLERNYPFFNVCFVIVRAQLKTKKKNLMAAFPVCTANSYEAR